MSPGLRSLLVLGTLARIPVTATTIALTFHIVGDLGQDYVSAGLVLAALTVGTGIGAPLFGYLVDSNGPRFVLSMVIVVQAAFWAVAPDLEYGLLVAGAFISGVFSFQPNVLVRQCIAAAVPEERLSAAFALDAASMELAFMVGPFLAAVIAETTSPRYMMFGIGVLNVLVAAIFVILDPPVNARTEAPGAPVSRIETAQGALSHLTPGLLAACGVGGAAMVVLGGTDVAVIAAMNTADQAAATGIVFAVWSVSAIVGGLIFSRLPRMLPAWGMLALLGICTAAVGTAAGGLWQLSLALIPAGLFCAPTVGLLAADVNRVARPGQQGVAMGLFSAATTAGLAVGTLIAGAVIDTHAAGWGFAAVGGAGLLVAVVLARVTSRSAPPGRLQA